MLFSQTTNGVLFGIVVAYFAIFLVLLLLRPDVLFLGARNLFRNSRRALVTILVICFGVTGLMLLCSFIENSFTGIREGTITSGTGHFQILPKGYESKSGPDRSQLAISNYDEIKKLLLANSEIAPEIKVVTAALDFTALIASGETSAMGAGRGIEPGHEDLLNAYDRVVEGTRLEQSALVDDGLVGAGLARTLGAKLGDVLTALSVSRSGSMSAVDLTVKGIVQGAAKEYDDTMLKLTLRQAQRLLGRQDVSQIVVLLRDTNKTDEVAAKTRRLLAAKGFDLEVLTWDQLAQFYHDVHDMYQGMFMVFLVIITTIILFSILNTMTMSVMERFEEIGTLRALGISRRTVHGLFVVEGLLTGAVGALASLALAFLIAALVNKVGGGIAMPPPPGRVVGYQAYFDLFTHPWIWSFGVVLSLTASLVASYWPARKAARMDIVAALRYY